MRKIAAFFSLLMLAAWLPAFAQPARAAEGPAGGDGVYSGVVQVGQFYHDGRGEQLTYYFADIGEKQYNKLNAELGGVESSGQEVESEIQLYSTKINLKDFVGKKVSFTGEAFEAHTIYHQRDIVFEIKELKPIP